MYIYIYIYIHLHVFYYFLKNMYLYSYVLNYLENDNSICISCLVSFAGIIHSSVNSAGAPFKHGSGVRTPTLAAIAGINASPVITISPRYVREGI